MFNFSDVDRAAKSPLASSQFTAHNANSGVAVDRSTPEIWQINSISMTHPSLGLGLIVGSFSVLLTGLWIQVCRLSARVQKRDRRIESLLAVDALTGLINRQTFCNTGQQLLDHTFNDEIANDEIAVLVLNIDQFTTVNDCFGHPAGDSLLHQVSDRLQQYIGEQDILARTGDDEFAILLNPGCHSRVDTFVTQIMSSLHEPFALSSMHQPQQRVYIHSRLGIAHHFSAQQSQAQQSQAQQNQAKIGLSRTGLSQTRPSQKTQQRKTQQNTKRFSQLLSQASIAMAQAKLERYGADRHDWKSRTVLFQPEMAAQMRARAKRQRSLRRALERNELRVHYQPIVDLKSSLTVGFEALVRWQHPEEGLLYPNDFLPLAEEIGLIVKIDRWVLRQVCEQLQSWQRRGLSPYVSVNLSGPHLDRADLVDHVSYRLSQYAIAPSQLNMEVTESVMIAEPEQAMNTLRQLRRMGLRVSLDDFGTGYSSLGYLQQFPVDVLKIDRSFVQRLGRVTSRRNKQDEFIVKSILSLAEGLNIRVVAEGIERDDQFCWLQQMQCSYGQGHFFARAIEPVAADDFLIQALRA